MKGACELTAAHASDAKNFDQRVEARLCSDGVDPCNGEQIGCQSSYWWCHCLEYVPKYGRSELGGFDGACGDLEIFLKLQVICGGGFNCKCRSKN